MKYSDEWRDIIGRFGRWIDFDDDYKWKRSINHGLAVSDLKANLHLPSLAGLNQAPGFANLSCLGTLADRILLHYTNGN